MRLVDAARQHMQLTTLTCAQADHFVEHGYVLIPDCLHPELARRWTERACRRLGYDAEDPATWREEIVWMDRCTTAPVREISPRGWGALCDVVGGEERIDPRVYEIESRHFTTIDSFEWSDAFIVNFRRGADQRWQAPSAAVGGWHKDGSYFRHFLDSREQALLVVLLWSDVAPRGGGTFIAPDSVPVVARYLAQRPWGAGPGDFGDLVHECREFMELTGPCGTLAVLHPYMLHASSHNHSGRPRFMSNPPLVLREPLRLHRSDPGTYSLLERATLHALGVDRYDFRPTAPRESHWQIRRAG